MVFLKMEYFIIIITKLIFVQNFTSFETVIIKMKNISSCYFCQLICYGLKVSANFNSLLILFFNQITVSILKQMQLNINLVINVPISNERLFLLLTA